jgi:Domain of unknown function (DUF4167)
VNNNFMRPGQHKNNNNRNRNRNNNSGRRNTGGGGGGSSNNKVFDSNGPDIKLRGTSQTIAEKYMQLGRDAQSSGDSVAAENYYQHAEHYYRLWAASQPAGHSLVMSKKLGEEEYDEEGQEIVEDDAAEQSTAPEGAAPVEGAEGQEAGSGEGTGAPMGDGQQQRGNRNFNNNRDNNNRNNRPRWQNRRNERYEPGQNTAPVAETSGEQGVEYSAPAASAEAAPAPVAETAAGQWEAPSFLQRPAPIAPAEPVADAPEASAPRRTRAPRKPRVDSDVAETPAAADVPPSSE